MLHNLHVHLEESNAEFIGIYSLLSVHRFAALAIETDIPLTFHCCIQSTLQSLYAAFYFTSLPRPSCLCSFPIKNMEHIHPLNVKFLI